MATSGADLVEAAGALIGGLGATLAFGFGLYVYRGQRQDARRDHATHISAWIVEGDQFGRVENSSRQAVYDVQAVYVELDTGVLIIGADRIIPVLPPGDRPEIVTKTDLLVGQANVALEVWFTDRAGLRWKRDRHGGLTEIETG